ncbi:MAG: RNA polymerase sigma factor [Clostridia bacterium]|nr:RNA polymerase sigma factor [Clostridia bacterium]
MRTSYHAPSPALLEECLKDMATGNQNALATLYEHTATALFSYILSVLKNRPDAEDTLQDCYLRILGAAPHYRSQGKPLAWMLTVARNLCMQRLRERQRETPLLEDGVNLFEETDGRLSMEDKTVLRECLTTLSDEERQIVVLHAVAGFRHREIAALLDLPLATVLSKYHRALKKLKNELTKGDPT